MKRRFPVAEEDVRISGCLIEIDGVTGRSVSIVRVELAKSSE